MNIETQVILGIQEDKNFEKEQNTTEHLNTGSSVQVYY